MKYLMGFPGGNKGDVFKHAHLVDCLKQWDISNYIEFHSGIGISLGSQSIDSQRYEGSPIRAIRTIMQTHANDFQATLHEKDKSNKNQLITYIKREFPKHQSQIKILGQWQDSSTTYENLDNQSLVVIDPTNINDYDEIIKTYLAKAISSQQGFFLYAAQTKPQHQSLVERLLTTTYSRKPQHKTQKDGQRTDHLIMVAPK